MRCARFFALAAVRRAAMNEREERFLVVRLTALGDILHTVPAVAALRAAHPKRENRLGCRAEMGAGAGGKSGDQ